MAGPDAEQPSVSKPEERKEDNMNNATDTSPPMDPESCKQRLLTVMDNYDPDVWVTSFLWKKQWFVERKDFVCCETVQHPVMDVAEYRSCKDHNAAIASRLVLAADLPPEALPAYTEALDVMEKLCINSLWVKKALELLRGFVEKREFRRVPYMYNELLVRSTSANGAELGVGWLEAIHRDLRGMGCLL